MYISRPFGIHCCVIVCHANIWQHLGYFSVGFVLLLLFSLISGSQYSHLCLFECQCKTRTGFHRTVPRVSRCMVRPCFITEDIEKVRRSNGRWLLKPRRCGSAAAGSGDLQLRLERLEHMCLGLEVAVERCPLKWLLVVTLLVAVWNKDRVLEVSKAVSSQFSRSSF